MDARPSEAAHQEPARWWEAAAQQPCGICGTAIGGDEHVIMRAEASSGKAANLRVVHGVCNNVAANSHPSLVALLTARKLGMRSFRVAEPGSAERGADIDVAASFRLGELVRCAPSRSPLIWVARRRNAAAVNRQIAAGTTPASSAGRTCTSRTGP